MMPDYDLGDRKLGVLPQVKSPDIRWGEAGREIGAAAGAVAGAANRVNAVRRREAELQKRAAERAAEIQSRADEREAQYRVAEGVNWYKSAWNGQYVQDPQSGETKRIPGIIDRTWQDFERDGTNPLKEMDRLSREFKRTDIYAKMTPAQRQHFDRAWKFKEDEFRRAASAKQYEISANKIKYENKVQDDADDSDVLDAETADSAIFDAAAERAAARKLFRRYGSSAVAEVDPDDPRFTIYDIALKGAKADDPATQGRYTQMYREYREIVKAYRLNRITNLTRLAERDVPGADQLLAEARITAWALEGKNAEGVEIWIGQGVDDKGNKRPAVRDHVDISEVEAKGLHSDIDHAAQKLKGLRELKTDKARREEFAKYKNYVGGFELALLDPKKIDETMLDYEGFESRLDKEALLTVEQKQNLLKQYRSLCQYKTKYDDDKKKFEETQKAEYGYFLNDVFYPASAHPDESDGEARKEFAANAPVWQNPKTAMAKLEAARMTGRLSKADFVAYHKYGTMMLQKEARTWWYKMYGKLDIPGLIGAEYGEEGVSKDIRKLRDKKQYTAATGIYAAVKNSRAKSYRDAADFVADTLAKDEPENDTESESLVPVEVLPKVYDTVMALSANGVDPADAVRAILQPALEEGLRRDLNERLYDPDYFKTITENYRQHGTHFTDEMLRQIAAGGGVNYYADRNQATSSNLLRQGRIKPEGAKDVNIK